MNQQSILPDLSGQYAESKTQKTILLDGQKVLFDKRGMLMPVELVAKNQNNGPQN